MCSTSLNENLYADIPCTECADRISGSSNSITYTLSSNTDCEYCHRVCEEDSESQTFGRENDQSPSKYLDQNIFTLLIPALEETLIEASKWNALRVQKCRFNGIDYIAEILWNCNPRRSKIFSPRLNVFDIPPFKEYLRQHPRPYYPKSWLWSEDEAVLHIQRYVRGWLVRKRADVQEMRQFWKDIAMKTVDETVPCIVQPYGVSKKVQEDKEYEITDEDLICCEQYRLMDRTKKVTRTL